MTKYFCDRCRKEIGKFKIFTVTVEPPEVRSWADNAEAGTYIFCYDCVRKLSKAMEQETETL